MENPQVNLLDEEFTNVTLQSVRRRKLLPVWIRIFVWIFMIMGCIAIPILIVGLTGMQVSLALYGLETNRVNSVTGLIILFLFLYKGAVAFLLWFEQQPAVIMAIIDAILGIVVCCFIMVFGSPFTFRLELVALIPYLVVMIRIKKRWVAWIGNP